MILNPVNKVLATILLSAAMLGGVSIWAYQKGHSSGSSVIQQKWDSERALLLSAALKVEQDNRSREAAHLIETGALEFRLRETEAEYEKALATVRIDFGNWMRSSEQRGASYRNWAEGISGERERLADHAERLDQSLSKGRELVAEFSVALKQCQRDLKSLGEQISIDRNLIGEMK